MAMNEAPQELRLSKKGDTLMVVFADTPYPMSAEYLRVCSPSAEVRGHGEDWKTIGGKKEVVIRAIIPVGQYAVRLMFSDGHNSGLYSWPVLHDLATNQEHYWQRYLTALKEKGASR
ncbi:DUF971 domain-containing protein [Suttonella sp. R2A3]|uniref:gamma-butyrobetaine hydroxylase-like domain-containing protein n=1 Tax=Suttonella sp. R2A3 TaxID=2908648 RepID=UPI001F38DAFD|nr:DUF971 domain-containing protein [Suttonella sp. R2A3]UJF24855.1 DUF971 domain-containing protein [Suttonella sp. R2A3]